MGARYSAGSSPAGKSLPNSGTSRIARSAEGRPSQAGRAVRLNVPGDVTYDEEVGGSSHPAG